ncbi:type VI secretion system protein TssA [Aquabacterium sp.]|uniref:type VI secretion system protein TssA n=1 Tax=Aquabacterium sp. TaxID=1872578 RepID=UPI002E374CDE|nr:type VI secretion system protein TssA [Aquabacterium sp.]HEX5312849.1 type VI secretion system protein TssA [Aquabacterium sp.]
MNQEALLSPIAGDQPCGEDLSFSTEFDQIAEMRREDDPTLDQGEWVTTLKVADWPGVVQLCTQLLTNRTKDLRLAMWLTEALALTKGYVGLKDGLKVCSALCRQYWQDLYPQADDGDMDERIGNISWLLQRVVALADTRPVIKSRQGAAYSLQDWRAAKLQSGSTPAYGQHDAQDNKVTLDQIKRALNETPREPLRDQLEALRETQAELLNWQEIIDGHLGDDGPGFVSAKEALSQALHDLERLAREAGLLENSEATSASEETEATDPNDHTSPRADASPTRGGGPLRSRAQALEQLREVAAYFRRTEPHSPVAYLAEKAVKWGEMPLHEWLRKVIKDQGAMSHLQELLGLESEDDQQQSY